LHLLQQEIKKGQVINADETPLQVMNEPGRSNTSQSYMWVFRGGQTDNPVVLFNYDPSRSGGVPTSYLSGYQGYVQTDGYKGYNKLGRESGISLVGCWAHARRYFMKVVKAKANKKKQGKADIVLNYIGKIYKIEKNAKNNCFTQEEIYQVRQEKVIPILNKLKTLLDKLEPLTPPKGLLGKAVNYTLNNWTRLIRFCENGYLRPDNNLAENAIRPFVVGRKNWLFSGHPKGAAASAAIYSLIETAKANNLKPYDYLYFLFKSLPLAKSEDDYKKLLPNYINKDDFLSDSIEHNGVY
jgi:transposase